MTSRLFLWTAALAFCGASAGAQTMKPGLWETTSKVGGSPEMDQAMAQMQKQLAGMPPAQRKQMEEMLGKQGVGMGAGGMSAKACVTREMIDRGEMQNQQQGNCKTTVTDKSSRGMKMNFTCTNPASSGEGVYTFQGDNAYTMSMKVTSARQGAPRTTTIDSTGKWLGSDCGSIKPISLPKQ
jgi:hypothetical protein